MKERKKTVGIGYHYLSLATVADGNSEVLFLPCFIERGVTQPASQAGEEVLIVATLSPGRTGINRFCPDRVKLVGKLRWEPKRGVELGAIHGSVSEQKILTLKLREKQKRKGPV